MIYLGHARSEGEGSGSDGSGAKGGHDSSCTTKSHILGEIVGVDVKFLCSEGYLCRQYGNTIESSSKVRHLVGTQRLRDLHLGFVGGCTDGNALRGKSLLGLNVGSADFLRPASDCGGGSNQTSTIPIGLVFDQFFRFIRNVPILRFC